MQHHDAAPLQLAAAKTGAVEHRLAQRARRLVLLSALRADAAHEPLERDEIRAIVEERTRPIPEIGAMRFADVITTALEQIRVNKLRSFFTLLGIIVSVAFLVAVVAIICHMPAGPPGPIAPATFEQHPAAPRAR